MSAGSPVIKGDNTVLWGTGGVYGTGIIVTASDSLEGEKVEIKDNNGFTVAAIYFDDKNVVSLEMIVQTAAPTLKRGDAVTVAGVVNCLVDSREKKWEQNGVQKFSLKATAYSGMTLA